MEGRERRDERTTPWKVGEINEAEGRRTGASSGYMFRRTRRENSRVNGVESVKCNAGK
jgi:hypothetical protein